MNITSPERNEELLGLIEPFLYEFTAKHRGSISAEHGMGLLKASHMVRPAPCCKTPRPVTRPDAWMM